MSNTDLDALSDRSQSSGGDDAVCFTTGIRNGFFGAGTIHAYLSADRRHPLVVAGISWGTVTAAAMQRAYRELEENREENREDDSQLEAQRWSWFQRFLSRLADITATRSAQ